jgi:DNA polymerase-3 subunit beta
MSSVDGVTGEGGEFTVAARKLMDICRALPEGAEITLQQDGEKIMIKSGRSRFSLQSLPAEDFPRIEAENWDQEISIEPGELRQLFEKTAFAMAQQDVRYYLNGLLLEITGKTLRAVATDGHRLAKSEIELAQAAAGERQAIIPRKAVHEVIRLLGDGEGKAVLKVSNNHLRIESDDVVFTSKLIDGRYPDYAKVIPSELTVDLRLDSTEFRDTLNRAAILTNEKFRGVRLNINDGNLTVTAHNPEQEEASDEMPIEYSGAPVEVGFNVNYLMDAISALPGNEVDFRLRDQNTSCVLNAPGSTDTLYLVMPMRL